MVITVASNPQPGKAGLCVSHCRVGSIIPPGTFAFCFSKGYGGGIITRLHTGVKNVQVDIYWMVKLKQMFHN
jgi:hypothetical protein